ncbi:MAG: HDOD domain-containing protein [Desulfovibrionales bacterium]|nr:HDOD domain-containing protein [Desulfovibrionales bacterium]
MINLNQLSDKDLPPLKPMVIRLWQLLNSQHTRLQDIAEAMSAEPVLCARIMAIANSPLYRGVEEILSPQKALIRLGLDEVKGIVYYLTLSDSMRKKNFPSSFDIRRFWSHSLSTALLSQKLCQYYPHLFPMTPEEREGAYLAGLLHDIGYVVMAALMPGEFRLMVKSWETETLPPLDTEEEIFGLSHPILSAKALNLWKFPKNVQLAVYAHHRDIPTDSRTGAIMLLKLADCLSTDAGYHFNPRFSVDLKRATIPPVLLAEDFQPVIQEVSLKVEMLVSQALS